MTVNDPDAIAEPEPQVLNLQELLEKGHPGEILPGKQRDRLVRAAEQYVANQGNAPDARERVKKVWIQNRYMPAYQRFTPRPGKEGDFG